MYPYFKEEDSQYHMIQENTYEIQLSSLPRSDLSSFTLVKSCLSLPATCICEIHVLYSTYGSLIDLSRTYMAGRYGYSRIIRILE